MGQWSRWTCTTPLPTPTNPKPNSSQNKHASCRACRRHVEGGQGGDREAASGFPQLVAMDHRRDGACAAIVGSLMPLLGLRLKGMRRWRRQSCSGSEEEAGSLVAGWEDARRVTFKDRRRCANRPQAGYGRGTVSGCGTGVWRQESWLELVSFASRLPWIAQFSPRVSTGSSPTQRGRRGTDWPELALPRLSSHVLPEGTFPTCERVT